MLATNVLVFCAVPLQSGGNPTWSPPLLLDVGAFCHYHAVADLNGDGTPDLIVPTRSTNTLHIFMNQGAGSFAPDSPLLSLFDILTVAAADLDRDGDLDLLEVGFLSQTLRIRPNDGSANFSTGMSLALGGNGHGIDIADFNGDGWVDVALTTAQGSTQHAQLFWNNQAGGLLPGPILATGNTPYFTTAGDVDADLDIDLVVANSGSDSISVFRNDQALGFTTLPPFSSDGGAPGRIEIADLDGDGNTELLVPHAGAFWISRFESVGGGAFDFVGRLQGTWTFGPMGLWVDSADLNADGHADAVAGPTPVDSIGTSIQDGSGGWGAIQALAGASNVTSVQLVDIDGNGTPDITASAHHTKALVVWFNLYLDCNANGASDAVDISTGVSPDCNGNGVPDECDLASGSEVDCDSDAQLDACQIAADASLDADADGTLDACEIPGTPFCFGDDSIPTPCPCVPPNIVPNPGSAPGHGCANSFNADGALLSSTGTTAPDTVQFTCAISSNYANFALMVKGNASSPNGVQLNDGIMCVSGAIIRFGSHYAATGGAPLGSWTYPNTIQTTAVSTATAQIAGQHAYYQLYYRNAMPNFCTAATANLSNAVDIMWR